MEKTAKHIQRTLGTRSAAAYMHRRGVRLQEALRVLAGRLAATV